MDIEEEMNMFKEIIFFKKIKCEKLNNKEFLKKKQNLWLRASFKLDRNPI